jgi:drug/metabolite transporter (DMT)-like permease
MNKKNGYMFYSVLVVLMWGIVPAFAKLGSLSGGLTTMWVNWFAVLGVLVIMLVNGSINKVSRTQPYLKLAVLGIIWPLIYSIAYFTCVEKGGAALTTITNYTWPLFYLILASVVGGKRFTKQCWVFVLMVVVAVAVSVFLEGTVRFVLLATILGLVAAITQALYSYFSENIKVDAWVVTLVVEIVTAVGATIYVLFRGETISWPSWQTIGYLAFIGVFSNGIGFWAFLKASQTSAESESTKVVFLAMMSFIPLIQVIILPILGVEIVSPARWFGVIMITLSLFWYRFYSRKTIE